MRGKFRTSGHTSEGVLDPHLGPGITSDIFPKQLQISADDLQQVVEVVGNAASKLADRFQLLGSDHRSLRRLERGFRLTPFCNVPGHFGESYELPVVVSNRVDHDMRPKASAVLSYPLTFMLPPSVTGCGLQACSREARGAILFRIEIGEVATDDLFGSVPLDALLSLEASGSLRLLQRQRRHFLLPLGLRIECREVVSYDLLGLKALKALRPRVPAGDMPVAIQHIDRVVGDRLNK
ncbi:hypothetical protein CDS [Bradyrhizobium sp.]|nr:hypothetical protein CDS [Bradyrhizobium sp.]